jgi:glyoxylase-like metal-dependent hydrolase (beta-lactamase superfamily II)
MDRRAFVRTGTSCAAQLALWGAIAPRALRERFAATRTGLQVATEPWGRIEKIGEQVWALISTPLAGGADARRTLSNGGIIAGRNGVAIIEGFASDAGAQWMAGMARQVTGRAPTHIMLTHYHGDHAGGLAGYRADGTAPLFITTDLTRARLTPGGRPAETLGGAELVAPGAPSVIDLGGTRLTITPRAGHTASDLSITVDDPRIVFGGDLLWNGIFPNYRDAIPSVLSRSVRDRPPPKPPTTSPCST